MMLFVFLAVALSAQVTVLIKSSGGATVFEPTIITAGEGDTILFDNRLTVVQNVVTTAGITTGQRCVARPDAPRNFTVVIGATSQVGVVLDTNNGWANTSPAQVVGIRGNQADCSNTSSASSYATIVVVPGSVCSSQTSDGACRGAGTTRIGNTNQACVWCGINGATNGGFCFTPPWVGINVCPCGDNSCFSHYGCPANANSVGCGSTCFTANSTVCPVFVPTPGGFGSGAASLSFSVLLAVAAILALVF